MMGRRDISGSCTREYRVQLTTWELYEIFVESSDEAAACAQAESIMVEVGPEAFRHRNGGIEDVMVIGAP